MSIADDRALEFLRLLWHVQHALERTSKRMAVTLGVTGPQRLVLRMIAREPDILGSEIAKRAHLHASTVSGILRRLERRGLITRERSAVDTRAIRLRLTAAGRPLTSRTGGTVEAAVTHVLSQASPDRVRHASSMLKMIADALDQVPERPARSRS